MLIYLATAAKLIAPRGQIGLELELSCSPSLCYVFAMWG